MSDDIGIGELFVTDDTETVFLFPKSKAHPAGVWVTFKKELSYGESCDIDCAGPASCGAIHCGEQACEIDCSGIGSCPQIDCAGSCRCDVDCSNSTACPSMSCPALPGTLCTDDREPGAACDSSVSVECDRCP